MLIVELGLPIVFDFEFQFAWGVKFNRCEKESFGYVISWNHDSVKAGGRAGDPATFFIVCRLFIHCPGGWVRPAASGYIGLLRMACYAIGLLRMACYAVR